MSVGTCVGARWGRLDRCVRVCFLPGAFVRSCMCLSGYILRLSGGWRWRVCGRISECGYCTSQHVVAFVRRACIGSASGLD